jgi:hypothetical protein
MAITNVGELKTAIADWINREDIADVIPDFISQADTRILTDHRSAVIPLDEEVVKVVGAAGQLSPYAFPEGVPQSLLVDDELVEPASWETYWQARTDSSLGARWAYYEGKIWFTGWPDRDEGANLDAEAVTIRVKTRTKEPLDLSSDANTSLMLTNHPELYLFAALTEASTYLRDMEGLQLYQVRYNGLMDEVSKGYLRRKIANGFVVSSIGADYNFDRSY